MSMKNVSTVYKIKRRSSIEKSKKKIGLVLAKISKMKDMVSLILKINNER